MQQTGNGDSTAGGKVEPVWGALPGQAHRTMSTVSVTSGLLTATTPRPRSEVFGFAFGNSSLADPTYGYPSWSMNLLTTIAYFGLNINWDGTILQSGSGWTTWNSSQLTSLVSTAHANGVRVILSINLHDFSGKSTSTMCAALHPNNRATAVAQTVAQVKKMGVDGVNIDYEGTNTLCYYGASLQTEMTALVAEMRAKLPKAYIAVDTYSGSAGDSSGFFNIPKIAPYVDSFFVMAYDMEYSNYHYPPLSCSSFCIGPTAPLTTYHYNDTTSMTQYTHVVPASKVILGVPYYGRKECVAGVTPTTAPPNARSVSGSVASDGYLDASTENGYYATTNYHSHREVHDTAGFERWDTWTSATAKCTREMYWDDSVSLGRKYDLVNKMALRGVGIFALQYGGGAPELWQQLQTKFVGCIDSALAASPSATEPPGANIRFTASSTGCTKPLYEFWLRYPNGQWVMKRGFGSNTWYWNTTGTPLGTYTVQVWANVSPLLNRRGATIASMTYKIALQPRCGTAALSPPTATQAASTSVAFTASSTGCGTPAYAYWVLQSGAWHLKRGFSLDPTWTWNTAGLRPGTYNFRVWANQYGHSTTYPEALSASKVTLTGCTSAALSPATASQPAGSTVVFAANSGGCANPQYEYWVRFPNGNWYLKRSFSADPAWSWNTSGLAPGTYTVRAWANQQGAYMGAYEAFGSSTVTLTGCTSATLTPSSGSSAAGTPVMFTASSGGCTNPVYEFWISYTPGKWRQMTGFGANTWTWNNTGWAKGVYHIRVWANQQGADTTTSEALGTSTRTVT
jgi:spore germination protein YaaH